MRLRVAEVDENAVAHVFGDKAVEPGNEPGCPAELGDKGEQRAVLVGRAEIAQTEMRFGMEPLLQCRGANPRSASNRLATTLGRSTCQADTGVAMPLTSTA